MQRHSLLNWVTQKYTRDELNRIELLEIKSGSYTLGYESYGFDAMNRVNAIEREDNKRDQFAYDWWAEWGRVSLYTVVYELPTPLNCIQRKY